MLPGDVLPVASLVVQSLVCLLLVIPMPSNSVRGMIVGGLNRIWDQHPAIRSAAALLCVFNAFLFITELRRLSWPEPPPPPPPPPRRGMPGLPGMPPPPPVNDFACEFQLGLFRSERNAYMSGFSLFIYFMMRRLLEIQQMLYKARKAEKEA
ncbi:hypothetical protein CTAYLR_002554 [Chrysophaeum taylorii]|uniref:BAP29/BAP31 transmembrane domain-containing protein n=1 Tax=Chrysophaeum taylorii TaxID=2483200 RepID=A0AAD7UF91_9STRA|nr:hypothetical protein CTAYLR_002554 [Chrysophaeum taylorii]